MTLCRKRWQATALQTLRALDRSGSNKITNSQCSILSIEDWRGNRRTGNWLVVGGRGSHLVGEFFLESVDFGTWNVAFEDVFELVEGVAFSSVFPNADGGGADAVRAQLFGEPKFSEDFAFAELSPGVVRVGVEGGDEVTAEEALGIVAYEQNADIEEESADGAAVTSSGGEADGGRACQLGPAATGKVGDGQQRFPDVSGAVGEAGRNGRISSGNGGGMVESKSGALALGR